METPFLTNKVLPQKELNTLLNAISEKPPVLFSIVGEVNTRASYSRQALLVTKDRFITFDFESESIISEIFFNDAVNFYNKRMYGNGIMRAEFENSTENFFRFNFTVTALCDAATAFATEIKNGSDADEAFAAVESTFEKQLSVCPKCGRTLSSRGVECVNCMNKGKLVKKLIVYMNGEWPTLILSVVLSLVTTAMALVPPYLTKMLVDEILPDKNKKLLLIVTVALVSINFCQQIINAIRGMLLRKAGDHIVQKIKCDVYEKAQHLPMRFYDKTSTGSIINRISSDTNTLQSFMLRITQEVVAQFFYMIGIIVVMLFMNWKLTLYSLIPVPVIVICSRYFRKKIYPFYLRIWKYSSRTTSVLADTIPGIRVIKSFTNEDNSVQRFNESVSDLYKTDISAGRILSIYPAIVNGLVITGSYAIWAIGGNMVINGVGGISPGLLVSFISYASMFYGPVNFFANFSDSVQNAMTSIEKLMDILDAEPEHDFGKGNCNADIGGRIEFKNVNFSFDRTKKVLKNINLVIEPGEIVGIVGTTGSGKSTLINLLLRYYDHYEGTITVGGVDIRDIDMQYYRSHIGFVQQEPMMFHDTIFNNIAYGDSSYTVDEVINAADIANAHEFIIRQPDGYDCVLGERGTGLSGGERQRVSIARAMLRNPKMLVFDEATASVDSETEHLIQEAIEKLISGRTTIMIAHRLSTLSKATKIVVVDNGEIIECGSPEELIALQGKYYRLVNIQSMADKLAESKRTENFD